MQEYFTLIMYLDKRIERNSMEISSTNSYGTRNIFYRLCRLELSLETLREFNWMFTDFYKAYIKRDDIKKCMCFFAQIKWSIFFYCIIGIFIYWTTMIHYSLFIPRAIACIELCYQFFCIVKINIGIDTQYFSIFIIFSLHNFFCCL